MENVARLRNWNVYVVPFDHHRTYGRMDELRPNGGPFTPSSHQLFFSQPRVIPCPYQMTWAGDSSAGTRS